jgi:hypothetical protein
MWNSHAIFILRTIKSDYWRWDFKHIALRDDGKICEYHEKVIDSWEKKREYLLPNLERLA